MRKSFILFLCFLALGSCAKHDVVQGNAHGVLLPLTYRKQLGTELCWAACQQMVMDYWHIQKKDTAALDWNQCEQAQYLYYITHGVPTPPIDSPACSADSVPAAYNIPYSPFEGIIPIIDRYTYTSADGIIPWDSLKSQIDSGNLVIACMGFAGTLGASNHFIVIDGYQYFSGSNHPFISYCDPWASDYAKHKLVRFIELSHPGAEMLLNMPGAYNYDTLTGYIDHIRPYHPQQ